MPQEYELKFVLQNMDLENNLRKLALDNPAYSVVLIEQHYLSKPARLRKATTLIRHGHDCGKAGDVSHKFAYKPKINGSVLEIETEIDEDDFRLLLSETKKSLLKIRFQEEQPCKNEHWIVDFFKSRGETYFTLAECELYGKIKIPTRTPSFVKDNIIFAAGVGNSNFSSRRLCDIPKATELYEEIVRGTYEESNETVPS